MAEPSAATPGSSTTSRTPAIKDKECQYCHQAFTSSSLGRHLDLYIKDKNAKLPDDIHNVEEIRRARGNVTRRQARTSSGKRDGSTPSSSKPTPIRDQRSPSTQGPYNNNPTPHSDGGPIRTYLNKATWQSTGVINDLPPMTDQSLYARGASPPRRPSTKEEIMHKHKSSDQRDGARAAELALKEVLESVKAATSRARPSSPLDFNFYGLSFPELCLQCLSAPRSLQSSPPAPDLDSWPIEAPGLVHYEMLDRWLNLKLQDWQRQRQAHPNLDYNEVSNGTANHPQDQSGHTPLSREANSYRQHLSSTYAQWKGHPDKKKQDTWLSELAKAYTREQEKHEETKTRLEQAEQKVQLLRSHLSQSQPTPDFSAYLPNPLPISASAATHLPPSDTWTYDTLISKWKGRLLSQRSIQQPLPHWTPTTTPNLNGTHTNGNTYTQPYRNEQDATDAEPPSDEDEDLADAPGDEDDMSQQNHGMSKDVLDPTLRNGLVDGDGQAGGRMLMGLREYDGSGGGRGGASSIRMQME